MNEEKFSGKAGIYEKFRPDYPKELIKHLINSLGLDKNVTVADIGAGTGKFSRLLLQNGIRVIAVEPNADMKETADKILSEYKNYSSVGNSAEHTGLDLGSVDFVTVAQAFHWFQHNEFKDECKRILKPQGKVVVIYNSRDDKNQAIRETDAVNTKFCPAFKGFSGGMRGNYHEKYKDFFADGKYETNKFNYDLQYDLNKFIGRSLSASYALGETDGNYPAYITELTDLFNKYSENGILHFTQYTECYIGTV